MTDSSVDWHSERQARFAFEQPAGCALADQLPLVESRRATGDHQPRRFEPVRGARRFVRDASRPPRLPASVDTRKFHVGENLAVTPGAVILRTEVFELIQYRSTNQQVHQVPLLVVPPTINKYYILDLAPGRSLVEYLVQQGQQVFAISWRNPDAAHGHFDFDTYASAVLESRAAVGEVTAQRSVHIAAACSGGMISAGHACASSGGG